MPNPARTAALVLTFVFGAAAFAHDGHLHHQQPYEQTVTGDSFDAQMGDAMQRMDRDMAVPRSGDPDRDFAAMMIPHHQGAVDMARVELQFGKDPVLRRLAQAIIVEQLQEIDVLQRQLKQLPPPLDTPRASNHDHPDNDNKEH